MFAKHPDCKQGDTPHTVNTKRMSVRKEEERITGLKGAEWWCRLEDDQRVHKEDVDQVGWRNVLAAGGGGKRESVRVC